MFRLAVETLSASREGQHHMIPLGDVCDARTDCFYDPGALMAQNGREGKRRILRSDGEIGVADARRNQADKNFILAGRPQAQRPLHEWTVGLFDDLSLNF